MHLNIEKNRVKYPFTVSGIYTSIVITVLSIALAALLLRDLLHVTYYLVSTIIITTVIFMLKRNVLYPRLTRPDEDRARTLESRRRIWMLLILTFLGLIAVLTLPLLLAQILDPSVWFISIISFTTGVSVAEILLYLHMPKTTSEPHDHKTTTI